MIWRDNPDTGAMILRQTLESRIRRLCADRQPKVREDLIQTLCDVATSLKVANLTANQRGIGMVLAAILSWELGIEQELPHLCRDLGGSFVSEFLDELHAAMKSARVI